MRELDAVLEGFVEAHATTLTPNEIACFESILDLPDPTLHAYLLGRSVPPDPAIAALVEHIRAGHHPAA
jgi:succinate dehydrogenase flavin-adding protein (antitoxin of CptAB toxin-antitoxin module)